jgi:CubicO group peptidase (beta-lactamase class C family)
MDSVAFILFALLVAIAPVAAQSQAVAANDCGVPAASSDGWEVAAPGDEGLAPETLCAIGPHFTNWSEADLHAVLVARHGRLVYEHYFAGQDEKWGQPLGLVKYQADMKHDLRSITKSVISLVIGIAIGKGEFPGLDLAVMPLLPKYVDLRTPAKDMITVRHLLTMSQGLVWNEDLPYANPMNSETQMDQAPDPVRYVFEQPVDAPPGAVFNYSGGSAVLLAELLRQRTGQAIDAYARAVLFEPMGITDVDWLRLAPDQPLAASGLRLRPRDTAKFGQLIQNGGAWHGVQIVPADWISAATSPQINGPPLWFYGYQFWLGRSLLKGKQVDWVAGVGYGGQRLFIVPALDLVVLVHAGLYRSGMQSWVPVVVLNRFVLQAVTDAP